MIDNIKKLACSLFIVMCLSSCKTKTKIHQDENTTILVQVFNDSIISTLEEQYEAYSLEKEKVVSRPMKIYLFKYNTKKIADTSLIKLLKQSELVKEAQQNGKVELRKN